MRLGLTGPVRPNAVSHGIVSTSCSLFPSLYCCWWCYATLPILRIPRRLSFRLSRVSVPNSGMECNTKSKIDGLVVRFTGADLSSKVQKLQGYVMLTEKMCHNFQRKKTYELKLGRNTEQT